VYEAILSSSENLRADSWIIDVKVAAPKSYAIEPLTRRNLLLEWLCHLVGAFQSRINGNTIEREISDGFPFSRNVLQKSCYTGL